MADTGSEPSAAGETEALNAALAAEHAAVWGYGVVGTALPAQQRALATAAENAHRDARDGLVSLLGEQGAEPVGPEGAYELPFPVRSAADAARLAVALEDGVAAAWTRVLAAAAVAPTRELAVGSLGATELRAVAWRARAGTTPVTNPFPGLPA